jgi:hypothetical protein
MLRQFNLNFICVSDTFILGLLSNYVNFLEKSGRELHKFLKIIH